MPPSLPALWKALLDLALPPGCPACAGAPGADGCFCPTCRQEVGLLGPGACPRCGQPQADDRLCLGCRFDPPAFDQALSLALHQGPLARAVRDFKYRRRLASGAALARFLAQGLPPAILGQAEVLAPVPLHYRRVLQRGFNQALVLARGLLRQHPAARRLLLAPDLLERRRHTRPQVGLDWDARQDNVAGAFALRRRWRERVRGQSILLLDDVFTTGATAAECARVLKAAGARRVTVVTLARAPGRGPSPAEE